MFDRNGPRDRDDARRTRPKPRRGRPWLALLAALVAVSVWAIPALGTPTKNVTVDPNASAGAPGFTDLDALTYAQAKTRLDQLSEITLPAAVSGLELIDVSNVRLDSNDAGHSLSLSGSANLPALHGGNQSVDLLVTAVWPDDTSSEPKLAIAAKTDDLALSEVNPLWDDTYGDVRFATARLAVSSADQQIDPATLPAAAREFYAEPVELTGGVSFAGRLQLDGRLADAFGYAGYSGDVELEGSLAASPAALFGHAGDTQLGALHLKATLGKSPTAPAWMTDRTSTYEFTIANRRPGLSIDEALTVALDGTTNHFHGHFGVAPSGAIEGAVEIDGALDAPFGLPANLSDVKLRLSRDQDAIEGALTFSVDVDGSPIHVTAGLVTGGGTTRADFSVDGSLTVPRLAALGGELLGTPVANVPGADDVSLDRASFSFSRGLFSIGAKATIRELQADAVLTLRSTPGASAKPLLALRLRNARLSDLSPDAGETVGNVALPALSLTATTLTELAAEDLTPQEREFFGDEAIRFSPGLSVDARLPLDALGVREALGFPAGSEVELRGTLGTVTLSDLRGSRVSPRNLDLQATLPAATDPTLIPTWVRPSGPTTLRFRYENGAVAVSFATSAHVLLGNARLATTIEGRLARNGARTSIGFTGTLANWRQPYGVSWIPTLDQARFRLDTTFGGAQPPVVRGSVAASAVIRGKPFALEFGLSSASATTANLTASFEGRASLGEIVRAFPNLSGPAADIAANPDLNALEIGPVRASVIAGQTSAFELTATTSYRNLESDLLVALRTDGRFTVGIKPRGSVDLDQLAADAPAINVALPKAAIVLGSEEGRQPVNRLTDGEYDFYKTLYGCADDATRGTCANFTSVELIRGLKLIAAFDLGDNIEEMAEEIGIQTGGHALVEGKIPVFGGSDFSLRASLGDFRFDKQPDWFHHGNVALEIGTGGLKFVGSLGVKIERKGWTKPCDALPYEQKCYDLLNFRIAAGVELQPTPSLTLTGALETEQPWKNAFGQSWLEIRRVALQLGVTMGAGPEVTMGFQGDVKIGSKDVAAALKVGLAPVAGPPFVRVNLIGFSAASRAGIALSDLMWLNQQITGTALQLDNAATPDISLRNLFLQYSQQTDRDLCLTQGIRFNADLYVGSNLPPVEAGANDVSGCRTLEVAPRTEASCIANQGNGCLARVFGRIDSSGLLAGGELSGFTLGPITLQDSSLDLALTPTDQHLRMKGGAQIGSFARGQAELAISRGGFAFTGDAELFGQNTVHGYLEANAAFDLRNPSFSVQAWLHADARTAITNAVGPRAERLRVPIAAFGELLRVIGGSGSVADVARLRQLLESSGATVPSEVRTMLDVLSNAQKQINDYGRPPLTLQPLLRGFSFGVGGTEGWRDPATCPVFEVDGGCWVTPPLGLIPGIPAPWEPGRCHNTVVNGICYFTPPFTVTVGGICSELNIRSQDCSWSTVMRRFVLQPLLDAVERTTGVRLNEATLPELVSRFANGAGSIVTVDCAYFSADATRLTQGNVSVDLAARLRLFGQEVKLGAGWNFRATGQTADGVVSSIIQSLFSTSRRECPNPPAGHEQPRPDTGVRSQTLTAALMQPTVDEGGVATVSATFDANALRYPAVAVRWGDGSTSTIPAGESRTVTASHSYANEANPTIAVTVQDAGAHTRQLVARVLNVKPATTALGATPSAPNERDVVTLRGAFTDPGERDRHTVRIDWGDGTPQQAITLGAGARTYAVPHRYEDDGGYRVTVDLLDDTGAIESRRTAVGVSNVAPSAITMHPRVPATEGATVAYAIEFADPGERDAHTVTVDWGDGSSQTVPVGERKRYVEVPHRYADDGSYDVRLTVDDGDRGLGRATASMRVRNVAPTVAAKLETNAIAAGTRARLFGTIDDPGVDDAHTVTIDWGTGYEKIDLARGQRTFEAEKPYDTAGQFTITADVSDEDGGHGQASLPLTVG